MVHYKLQFEFSAYLTLAVNLTKTEKKGRAGKESLFEEVGFCQFCLVALSFTPP